MKSVKINDVWLMTSECGYVLYKDKETCKVIFIDDAIKILDKELINDHDLITINKIESFISYLEGEDFTEVTEDEIELVLGEIKYANSKLIVFLLDDNSNVNMEKLIVVRFNDIGEYLEVINKKELVKELIDFIPLRDINVLLETEL